jgi:hypothetical protein
MKDLPIDDEVISISRTALDTRAPVDERYDATAQVAKTVAPAVPRFDRSMIVKAAVDAHRLTERLNRQSLPGRPKSGNPDVYGIFKYHDYLRRPAPMGFTELRAILQHNPVTSSIMFTFSRWVSRMAKPVQEDYESGFRIKLRGPRRRLSEGERQRVEWLERFVMNCGAEFDPFKRELLERDDLIGYLKKSTLDTLALDAMPTEIIRTPSGRIHGWAHVDGATVYLAPKEGLEPDAVPPPNADPERLPDPEWVKAVEATGDGTTVTQWFGYDEILYRPRNPRPDVYGEGYGISESELIMRVITGFINLLNYNQKAYEDNHIPQGFLQLWGDFKQDDVEDFKAEWAAMVAGVSNAWRLPLLVSEKGKEAGANFIKTGVEVTEMHFIKGTLMYVGLECAMRGIDPEEINFESFSSKTSSLSDGSIEAKLINSKNKGFYPLLQHHEAYLNQILQAVDPDAYLEWTGFISAKDAWERDAKALTFGELRERQGLPLSGIELLDSAPIDPTMQSVYLQAMGQQMQGFAGESLEGMPPELQQQLAQGGWPPANEEGEEGEVAEQDADDQESDNEAEDADGPTGSFQKLRDALLLDGHE